MEAESAYIEAYNKLSKLEEDYLKPIKWTCYENLRVCMKAIDPFRDIESIQKDIDKLMRPYDKFLGNIAIVKGQLLISEKERLDGLEDVPRLDSYVDSVSEAVAKRISEAGEVGGMEVTDVSVEGGRTTISITDNTAKKQGRKKAKDLPEGIYPTSADMAKRERDYA